MHIMTEKVSLTGLPPKTKHSEKKKSVKSEKWDEKKGSTPNGASGMSLEQMEASLRVPLRTQA
jgi:hypothetical protein